MSVELSPEREMAREGYRQRIMEIIAGKAVEVTVKEERDDGSISTTGDCGV